MSSNVALAELQAARNQLPIRAGGGGSKSSEDDSFRRSSRIKAESFWSATSVTVILVLFLILAVFFILGERLDCPFPERGTGSSRYYFLTLFFS